MQLTGLCAAPSPTLCSGKTTDRHSRDPSSTNVAWRREATVRADNVLTNEMPAGDLQVPVTARDHVRGPDSAPVTLVEYADYECPYSRIAYRVIKECSASWVVSCASSTGTLPHVRSTLCAACGGSGRGRVEPGQVLG